MKKGFTLVEIMIVVAIIGLLAVIAMPAYYRANIRAKGVRAANDMRTFGGAFVTFAVDNGYYPKDNHEALPSGMDPYIDEDKFNAPTPLGGRYNWEGPNRHDFAGVAISSLDISDEWLQIIDETIDEGKVYEGQFMKTSKGRYTYIVE